MNDSKVQIKDQLNEIINWLKENNKMILFAITITGAIISIIEFIFPFTYRTQCQQYYGIQLDCFDSKIYQERWMIIVLIIVISFIYIIIQHGLQQSKKSRTTLLIDILFEWLLLFFINYFMLVVLINYRVLSWLADLDEKYIIPVTIIIAIMSIFISLFICLLLYQYQPNTVVISLAIIGVICQIIFILVFICSIGLPNPTNLNRYTLASVETVDIGTQNNNKNSQEKNQIEYIVVGNYNNDFVCMELKDISDKKSIDETIILVLDGEKYAIQKNEYKLFSSDDINCLKTVSSVDITKDIYCEK